MSYLRNEYMGDNIKITIILINWLNCRLTYKSSHNPINLRKYKKPNNYKKMISDTIILFKKLY